jgi:glycosyltransferase involved in cell wall biosynthesis
MSSTKLKLLFITDWYAPAFKGGGPIRSLVNLVEKFQADYDCYIYTSDKDFGEVEPLDGIEADTWANKNGVHVYYRSGKMTFKRVKSIIAEINPDRIYLNSMFSNMIIPILVAYASNKIMIAPRGMLNASALAVKPIRKFFYLWFLRTFGFAKHFTFHATSAEEKKVIQQIFPNAKSIVVAGNIPCAISIDLNQVTKAYGQLNMVFVGRMHPIKNLYLLLEALKNVEGKIVLDVIATKEDEDYLEKCKVMAGTLPENIHISWFLDLPPTEIKRHLLHAHLFTLLSEVESFGHAIFEALAVGCPILISNNTPWKNLLVQNAGLDLPIHDLLKITAAIQDFVNMDNQEWQAYRKGAHELAKAYTESLDVNKLYRPLFEN